MDIEEQIDRVVSYLLLASNKHLPSFDGAYFTGDSSLINVRWLWLETFDAYKRTLQASGDVLDIATVAIDEDENVNLNRYRAGCSKTNNYLRRIPDAAHWMATIDVLSIEPSGHVLTPLSCALKRVDGSWTGTGDNAPARIDSMHALCEQHFPSLWTTSRIFWSVKLGFRGHPGISILTTNEGARAAFRLRDIPNGERRRKALSHFVKEHMRRTPASQDDVRVSEHVRGAESFSWNGLQCRITPPSVDRETHAAIAASMLANDAARQSQ